MIMKFQRHGIPCVLSIAAATVSLASASDGTWTLNNNGNWSASGNWAGGVIADGSGFTANFTANITADRTVTLDSNRTIGRIVFTDSTTSSNNLILGGTSSLTLASGVTPSIDVTQSGRTLTINHQLAGTQGFSKDGPGQLALTNANNALTLSGPVKLNSGVIQVFAAGALGTGDITLAGGELHLINNTNTSFNHNVTLTGSAAISSTKVSGTSGDVSHSLGTLNIGASTLSLNKFFATTTGTLSFSSTTLSGNATFNTNTSTFLNLGAVDGAFSITKTGAGTLLLSSPSTYSGSTTLSAGVASISASSHLGNGSATNTLVFNGGTLQSTANTYALGSSRSVALTGNGTIQVDAGKLTIDGAVSGSGNLSKTGAGVLALTGASSATGATSIVNGVLAAASGALASGNVALGFSGDRFTYGILGVDAGSSFTRAVGTGAGQISWVAGSGGFAATGDGTASVNLGGNATPSTLSLGAGGFYAGSTGGGVATDYRFTLGHSTSTGTIDFQNSINLNGRRFVLVAMNGSAAVDSIISGDITGSGNGTDGFVKFGDGTTALTGTNTYSGNTIVTDGTLLVHGSVGNSTVNVSTAGTLGGNGSIAGAVNISSGGKIAAGASVGSLATGTLTFTTGSSLVAELNPSDSGLGDLVAANGQFNLSGTATLSLTGAELSLWELNDKITLVSYFDIDGSTPGWNGGIFSGIADDSLQVFGGNTWLFNYDDISGGLNFPGEQASGANARFFTMTLVPEPSAPLLGLASLGIMVILQRKRR